jgi:hypothetical protein
VTAAGDIVGEVFCVDIMDMFEVPELY